MGLEILLGIKYASLFLTAALTLDNAIDAVAKAFGNKEWDTACGLIAIKLRSLLVKVDPTAVAAPPAVDTKPDSQNSVT